MVGTLLFQGQGLSKILAEKSEAQTVEKHPGIKEVAWCTVDHPAQRANLYGNPAITVPFTWVGMLRLWCLSQ